MILEFLLTSKVKVFIGIMLVYFALVATDKMTSNNTNVEKPKTDTLKTIRTDSLKMDIRKTIEEAKRAVNNLKTVARKS